MDTFIENNRKYIKELTEALEDIPDVVDVIISPHVEFDRNRLVVAVRYGNMVSMSFKNDELPSVSEVVSMFESVR